MAKFMDFPKDDKYLRELLPSIIGIGPRQEIAFYGSCFIAHSHMAVTAKHVVEEMVRRDPGIQSGEPAFEYWVVQVSHEHGLKYVVWTFDSIGIANSSDLALLWLRDLNDHAAEYREAHAWKFVRMTLQPPTVGEKVTAIGIHSVNFEGSKVGSDGKFEHVAYNDKISLSTGIVTDVFLDGRDRAMYPFPCFEVDARFDAGMSGGLVMNESGQVCGIVSGSLPSGSDDERHVSYAALLWPIMTIPISGALVAHGDPSRSYPLFKLAQDGVFRPEGWDLLQVLHDDGKLPRLTLVLPVPSFAPTASE